MKNLDDVDSHKNNDIEDDAIVVNKISGKVCQSHCLLILLSAK